MEGLQRLRDSWRSSSELACSIERAFDAIGFTQQFVDACVTPATSQAAPRKSIVIKDSVWGMIELDVASVRLLDSPLLQRLRGIRQLGLSSITYPSAEHSRFIHSLGMYCVVSRFLDQISRRAEMDPEEAGDYDPNVLTFVKPTQLDRNLARNLLHASLLHDVGHMPFSHVTERVLATNGTQFRCGGALVSDLVADTNRRLRKRISFSECLSLLIVLSSRFETFYNRYVSPGYPDAILCISSLIAGLPPDPVMSGVADLISATAVDADKVDYINRDSLACGIPVGVDVSRIFLRSGFVQVSREKLRDLKIKSSGSDHEVLFVVNASGMDTIDELAQARASLYQRVYLHGVTRTAERLLGQSLEANVRAGTVRDVGLLDALDLWAMNDTNLLERLRASEEPQVRVTAEALSLRQLPKKAAVITAQAMETHFPMREIFRGMEGSAIEAITKQITGAELESLTERNLVGVHLQELEQQIRVEIARVAEAVKKISPHLVPAASPAIVAVVGMAWLETPKKDCIILENGDLVHSSDETTVDEQGDASDIFKSAAYVMVDAP